LASSLTLQRRIGTGGKLLAVLLAVVLVWIIAHGVWRIFIAGSGPVHAPAPPLDTQSAARAIVSANLFGGGAAPAMAAAQPSSLNLRLKGVYAAPGKFLSFAILSVDGHSDIGVVVGSEVKSGVKLTEVNPDYILIVHDGLIERVNLASNQSASVASGPNAPPLNVQATAPNNYTISRNEFVNLISDPRQLMALAQLGSAPGGGILVSEAAATGPVVKMGLKQGDIIQKINGQPVSGKDDLLKLAANSPNTPEVTVEGTRNGQPLRITYNVQP
jgi:type II secretory pathway component PulC